MGGVEAAAGAGRRLERGPLGPAPAARAGVRRSRRRVPDDRRRASLGGRDGTLLHRQRRQSLEQTRAGALRAEGPLDPAARTADRRGIDWRSSWLPSDPRRTADRRADDVDRQRRQRRGTVDVRSDGERHRRPLSYAVAASCRAATSATWGLCCDLRLRRHAVGVRSPDRRRRRMGGGVARPGGVRADRTQAGCDPATSSHAEFISPQECSSG